MGLISVASAQCYNYMPLYVYPSYNYLYLLNIFDGINLQVSLCLSHHPSSRRLPNTRIKLGSRMWDSLESQLESQLLYDWRFSAIQFVLATSSLRLTASNFIFQLNTCGYSPYVTSSLTRRWVCSLQLLLALASTFIPRSDSCGHS
jgi:hypothetical protein